MKKTVLYRLYNNINLVLLLLFIISFFSGISSIINYVSLGCVCLFNTICCCIYASKRKTGKTNIILQKEGELFQDYIARKNLRKFEIRVWSLGDKEIPNNNLLNLFSYLAIGIFLILLLVLTILMEPICIFDFQIIDEIFFYKINYYKYFIRIVQRILPLFLCFTVNKITLNLLWYILIYL